MSAVLGIDGAWTVGQPSGVCLVEQVAETWRCVAVAPSYDAFYALAEGQQVDWCAPGRVRGGDPDPERLLAVCGALLRGGSVDVVAVDMPLATVPITGRRAADSRISSVYGSRGCAVHSPTPARPGPLAERIRDGFEKRGFALATTVCGEKACPALVEVYPHPAVLCLLNAAYRIPYKASRAQRYWPAATGAERVANLLDAFRRIKEALDAYIGGIDIPIPTACPSLGALKRYEDALDAAVCAWVGIAFLEGRAEPYGDETAAIWVPKATSEYDSGPRPASRS